MYYYVVQALPEQTVDMIPEFLQVLLEGDPYQLIKDKLVEIYDTSD